MMELKNINQIESATKLGRAETFRLGTALVFVVGIMLMTGTTVSGISNGYLLVAAAMIGGYMAMNIGANDVANNVGPAVGSKALTLTGAIIIAAIFEGDNAVEVVRATMGETDPARAMPGTIRGDLALDIERNLIHGSDSEETAEKEIDIFFSKEEIFRYPREIERWLTEP